MTTVLTHTIVSLTPPKVGQVFETQKSRTEALCLRVDTKPNGNLSIQYISIKNMQRFIESDNNNYTPPTEWTTWYQLPKYDQPKYGTVIDWSSYPKDIDDSWECECWNCSETFEVDGYRDFVDCVEDGFNGAHYQREYRVETFNSVWQCPKCHTMNFEEKNI